MLSYRDTQTSSAQSCDQAVYVHVGLPKTATSLVQARLYPHHDQIDYLGKLLPGNSFVTRGVEQLVQLMLRKGTFRCEVGQARRIFDREIGPRLGQGRIVLLSMEDGSLGSLRRFRQKLANLRAVCGDVRILFTVRQPHAFIESMYFQRMRRNNFGGQRRYSAPQLLTIEQWLDSLWQRGEQAELSYLHFGEKIAACDEMIGYQRTHVLIFEELQRHAQAYIDKLCDALGIRRVDAAGILRGGQQNPRVRASQLARLAEISRSPWQALRFRLARPGQRRRMLGPAEGPAAAAQLSARWSTRVDEMTRPGIDRLCSQRNLPLREYGY